MKRPTIAGWASIAVLALVALAAGYRVLELSADRGETTPESTPAAPAGAPTGSLYGRVTTVDGATYQGRLRWGGDEEAFWGDYFNGVKAGNRWAAHVAPDRLPTELQTIGIFGFELRRRERPIDLGRPFMTRFGDIVRIEAPGLGEVRVTLKSGAAFDLDRLEAGDFDDGLRVWDGERGVVDLPSLRIRTVELLADPRPGGAPPRLHGTVRTRQGQLTGFVRWNRDEAIGSDTLHGHTADGEVELPFHSIGSIERRPDEGSLVTLLDGREVALSDTPDVGDGNRGIFVDDPRYGRALVSWEAFERVDFSPGGDSPTYDDFPPGRPLTGSVTTRDGRRLAGRLVYDLDESESTETLDASSGGVSYTIAFGRIASIAPPGSDAGDRRLGRVTLHGGEVLELEPSGDLGEANAGVLIFVDGREGPEYVTWADVERIDLAPQGAGSG